MKFQINKCRFEQVKDKIVCNARGQVSPFDSYLEERILKSQHYEIINNSKQIGYFSIQNKNLLTQFYLEKEFRGFAQEIFNKIIKYEEVQKAFISTGDEFFLSHAMDLSKNVELGAYFFQDTKLTVPSEKIIDNFEYKIATLNDVEFIKEKSQDFFDKIDERIKRKEIYICFINDRKVSFGIIEESKLYENVASIGMFTIAQERQSGVGRNTIIKLKEICYENGIIPIAGCWYYNHNSKKTLESAGMYTQTRLLNIHF